MEALYQEIAYQADLNLAETIRHRMKTAPKAILHEQNGFILFSIGALARNGHLNGALRLNSKIQPDIFLKAAEPFFQPMSPNYVIWVRAHADSDLEQYLNNLAYVAQRKPGSAGMFIQQAFRSCSLPDGITINRIEDQSRVADYMEVTQAAFSMSKEQSCSVFGSNESLTANNIAAFVAYQTDKPVAAAMTLLTDKTAGIYWVGTIPEVRGKGLGAVMTQMATNAGFELGATTVILQASVSGEPLYRRLGYQIFTHYRWYSPSQ
ncbi:MAG: GNAT family N-acetyltransferase [Acidobacteriota bacterium]